MPAVLVLLAILVAGGVGLGAEQSTPGEALYPVKVGINEKVRGAFNLSAENEADWRALLTERRLSEAERLALAGELSAEIVADLEARLEAHAAAYEENIAELKADENYAAIARVSARFESSLRAHRAILLEIASRVEGDIKNRLESLIADIDSEIAIVVAVRADAETRIDADLEGEVEAKTVAALEARLAATTTHLENLKRFVAEKSDRLSAEVKAEAEARLSEAEEDVAAAKARFEAKAYAEVQTLIRQIDDVVNETRTMVTAHGVLGLGLRANNDDDEDEGDDEDDENNKDNQTNIDANANVRAESRANSDNTNAGANGYGQIKVDIGL